MTEQNIESGGLVLVLGNYPLARQFSMDRFARLVEQAFEGTAWVVERQHPRIILGRIWANKWTAYVDNYLFFGVWVWWRLRRRPRVDLVHIADHSNSPWTFFCGRTPTLATVHDLLAVRAALGEDGTGCRASRMGVLLQDAIVRGLRRASGLVCDSGATREDVMRLVAPSRPPEVVFVAVAGGFFEGSDLPVQVLRERLGIEGPYLFHVGSGLPRKNRPTLVRVLRRARELGFDGSLVLAGEAPDAELLDLIRVERMEKNVVVAGGVTEDELKALYSGAHALLFPSLSEGFGWPCVEAGACGCAVISANTTSLPEVCGEGGQLFEPFDVEGMARAVVALNQPSEQTRWRIAARRNAERFTLNAMADGYGKEYLRLLNALAP